MFANIPNVKLGILAVSRDCFPIMHQGVSFFSSLAQTLSSPEATRQLVDELVETDKQTGKTTLRIPVPDKETVQNVLGAFAKLFGWILTFNSDIKILQNGSTMIQHQYEVKLVLK